MATNSIYEQMLLGSPLRSPASDMPYKKESELQKAINAEKNTAGNKSVQLSPGVLSAIDVAALSDNAQTLKDTLLGYRQEAGVDDLKRELENYRSIPMQHNNKILAQWADDTFGGNLTKAVGTPQSAEERAVMGIKLQDMIQSREGALSNALTKLASLSKTSQQPVNVITAGQERTDTKEKTDTKAGQNYLPGKPAGNGLKRLSEGAVKDLSGFDTVLSEMEDIKNKKSAIDTGPAAGRRNALAQMAGIDDPQVSELASKVGMNFYNYLIENTGKQFTQNERSFVSKNTPQMNDNDATFIKKMNNIENFLKKKRNDRLENFKKSKYDVTEYKLSDMTPSGGGGNKKVTDADINKMSEAELKAYLGES